MASSITSPSPHKLTFPNPKFSCSAPRRHPPAYLSQSYPRASDSVLCLCHSHSSDSPSPSDRPVPWRWDSAIQGLVKSAIQSFDSYVKSQRPDGDGNGSERRERDVGDEWDWDRWKKHFEEVDEQERLISVLKSQLGRAVQMEDYEEAGRIKVAMAAAATSDAVGMAVYQLNRAISEERYQDAAFIRDKASAGLVGWWAGISEDTKDPYGIIIRITAEHGRYVARSYSPRQLATAAAGATLFEVFLKVDEKGEYKDQAVYLKQKEDLGDATTGSPKGLGIISNLKPIDSTEGKSDLLFPSIEDEDDDEDSNGVEDGPDLPDELPGFKNILPDVVPGVKVKVLKVTAPEKVDKDLIATVIEQMIEEEEEDEEVDAEEENDVEIEELEAEDEIKVENVQDKGIMEVDADSAVTKSAGRKEFAVKVVIGGLVQKLSSNISSGDLLRVPAKLEKNGRSSFSFHLEKERTHGDVSGKKQKSLDIEAKLKGRRSIDHVMLDLAKFIAGEKVPLKVLKDVGELISLTLNQSRNHRRLSGSTSFNRIEIPGTPDPLNGLYIGAHGIYTSEVIHLRRKFGQWKEDTKIGSPPNLEFYEYVEALKLTGDRYVPAGEVAFRAKIGKRYQLPHKGIIPEELGVIARYKGQGRLAEPGFRNPRWVDGELVILDGKYIRGGPVVGFVYWASEYQFLVFFNRLRLQE